MPHYITPPHFSPDSRVDGVLGDDFSFLRNTLEFTFTNIWTYRDYQRRVIYDIWVN